MESKFRNAIAPCLLICGCGQYTPMAISEVIPIQEEVGSTLIVSWDENIESDLAGYEIHYGNSSGVYGDVIDVKNVNIFTFDSLTVGETYFFAVTAYDDSSNVSDFSNEVSAIVTARPPDTTAAKKWNIEFENETGELDSLIVLEIEPHGNEMSTGSGWTIWGHGEGTDSGLYILNPDRFMIRVAFDAKLIDDDGSCTEKPRKLKVGSNPSNPWFIDTSWQTIEIVSNENRIFIINYADDCYIEDESDANVRIENIQIWR